MNIVQTSRALGLSIGLIAASAVIVPMSASAQDSYVLDLSRNIKKISSDGTVSTFLTGTTIANDLAIDVSGNLFISDDGTSIKKIAPDKTISTIATGGLGFNALALDSMGNLFVSDNSSIKKVATDGTVSTFATGFSGTDIAVDSSGNLFISDFINNSIKKVATDGTVSTFVSGILKPFALTFDSSYNLFVASGGNTESILKITPDGTIGNFATIPFTYSLAFDSSGTLLAARYINNKIDKITTDGTVSNFVTTGLTNPYSIVVAPSASASTAVPEPFTIVGTLIGGTAALRMRKKLKSSGKV